MRRSPLEPKWRKAARLALYGALGTLAVVLVILGKGLEPLLENPELWGATEWADRPEVRLLRDYVRLDTVAGAEIRGAEFLRDLLAEEGIEATLEPLGDGRANLWAVLEGEDPDALVLHHHIDVSPAGDAEDWLFPPFGADLDGPWLYGRGVFDMKSYAAAQLVAFLEIARSDRPLRRSVMLLATSDEEPGSKLGTRWLISQHPELVERMWAVLTEGGAVEALSPDDIKYWGIEAAQFQIVRARACSTSRERLEDLEEDLAAWPANEIPAVASPELEGFFAEYGPTRSRIFVRRILTSARDLAIHQRRLRDAPRFVRDLMFSSASSGTVEADPSGGYFLDVNLLLAPGADFETSVEVLLPNWVRHGIAWTILPPEGAGHGSPLTHEVFTTGVEVLENHYPQASAGSYFLPYNITDARFFRAQGIPTYGFSPFLFFTTDTFRADKINERVPLPGFVSGVEIYVELVKRLALGQN